MPWRAPLFFICFQSRLPRLGGLRPLFEKIFLKRERKRRVFGWSLRSVVPLLLVRHFSYSWDFTTMRRRQWLLLLRLKLQRADTLTMTLMAQRKFESSAWKHPEAEAMRLHSYFS